MDENETAAPLKRLQTLESVVMAMREEVVRLKSDVAKLRGEPVGGVDVGRSAAGAAGSTPRPPLMPIGSHPGTTPASASSPSSGHTQRTAQRPAPERKSLDLEKIVGRYGTIAVATIAILLGVGAFLQWAIARELLGPEVRVALGVLAALVIGALGFRFRRSGSERFGNVLLAIALAVVHVVAWAAGPNLNLVPSVVALGVATVASAALAALALADREQSLFAVGLGGALLAPFVTSDGGGDVPMLLTFGWIVSTAAIVALREPAWSLSRRLLTVFAGLYAGAAFVGLGSAHTAADWRLPSLFLGAVVVSALVLGEPEGRRGLSRSLLLLMALALAVAGLNIAQPDWGTALFALVGALAVHAMRRRAAAASEVGSEAAFDAIALPLIFLVVALVSLEAPSSRDGAIVGGVWAALGAIMITVSPVSQRGWHISVVATALQAAVVLGLHDQALYMTLASAVIAAASVMVLRGEKSEALLMPIGLALGAATLRSYEMLSSRPAHDYTPFLTEASLAALGAVIAWVAFARIAPPALFGESATAGGAEARPEVGLLRMAGPLAVFLWGREELGRAFSSDMSSFLLITYYALSGVVSIGIGRRRAIPVLRHLGLALALFAAAKAVLGASDLRSIGLRVGSYLVVGAFLLGVGYWYRATAAEREEEGVTSG